MNIWLVSNFFKEDVNRVDHDLDYIEEILIIDMCLFVDDLFLEELDYVFEMSLWFIDGVFDAFGVEDREYFKDSPEIGSGVGLSLVVNVKDGLLDSSLQNVCYFVDPGFSVLAAELLETLDSAQRDIILFDEEEGEFVQERGQIELERFGRVVDMCFPDIGGLGDDLLVQVSSEDVDADQRLVEDGRAELVPFEDLYQLSQQRAASQTLDVVVTEQALVDSLQQQLVPPVPVGLDEGLQHSLSQSVHLIVRVADCLNHRVQNLRQVLLHSLLHHQMQIHEYPQVPLLYSILLHAHLLQQHRQYHLEILLS